MLTLGLLGCSKAKLPVPAPAWLMYSASPRFSQQYQRLKASCDRVMVVSAEHGLIAHDAVLRPYDKVLADLEAAEMGAWCDRVQSAILSLSPRRVVSCLQGKYSRVLTALGVPVESLAAGTMFEAAASVGRQGKLWRSRLKCGWPLGALLELVASEGPVPLPRIKSWLLSRGYAPKTVEAQLYRVVQCPLHELTPDGLVNRYVDTA